MKCNEIMFQMPLVYACMENIGMQEVQCALRNISKPIIMPYAAQNSKSQITLMLGLLPRNCVKKAIMPFCLRFMVEAKLMKNWSEGYIDVKQLRFRIIPLGVHR